MNEAETDRTGLAANLRMGDADLVVVGTSHAELPAAERERFHLSEEGRLAVGAMIRQIRGVHEFVILNTCNRIEILAVARQDEATFGLLEKVLGLDRLDPTQRYRKTGAAAFEHLCLVTAGLLSQMVGETHVTAQVKHAVDLAVGAGWAAGLLREWANVALHVSKDIRAETGPLLKCDEIEDVCLGYLASRVPALEGEAVMVIGAGVIGRSLVEKAVRRGIRCLWGYHVHKPEVPPEWGERVEVCALDVIRTRLAEATVVISAVKAPGFVLDERHAAGFGRGRTVLAVDLAMPRTVDPRLYEWVPGLQVVDLDGLKHWRRLTSGVLEKVMDRSRAIVQAHGGLYARIRANLQGGVGSGRTGVSPVDVCPAFDQRMAARREMMRRVEELVA